MLDFFLRAILGITNEFFIIALMTTGFFLLNRKIFGTALCLLLFTMIFNPFLKAIWQMPRLLEFVDGYAFPSGHMQTSFVLWAWIVYEYREIKLLRLSMLMPFGVGCALIYFEYHNLIDILGAIGFGSLTLLLYRFIAKTRWSYENPLFPAFTLIPLSILLLVFFPSPQRPSHVWLAEGALNGFVLGWFFLEKFSLLQAKKLKERMLIVLLTFGGIVSVYFLFRAIEFNVTLGTRLYIQYFTIALWMSFGAPLTCWKGKRIRSQASP